MGVPPPQKFAKLYELLYKDQAESRFGKQYGMPDPTKPRERVRWSSIVKSVDLGTLAVLSGQYPIARGWFEIAFWERFRDIEEDFQQVKKIPDDGKLEYRAGSDDASTFAGHTSQAARMAALAFREPSEVKEIGRLRDAVNWNVRYVEAILPSFLSYKLDRWSCYGVNGFSGLIHEGGIVPALYFGDSALVKRCGPLREMLRTYVKPVNDGKHTAWRRDYVVLDDLATFDALLSHDATGFQKGLAADAARRGNFGGSPSYYKYCYYEHLAVFLTASRELPKLVPGPITSLPEGLTAGAYWK